MNKKIVELIAQFSSHAILLPVNKPELERVIEILFSQLFPVSASANRNRCELDLTTIYHALYGNISRLVEPAKAEEIIEIFFGKLSEIQNRLYQDAKAFLDNDPAAESLEEVVLAYPGFFALTVHRIAHEFYKLKVPIVPRLFSEYAHAKVGIDIHPGAQIGKNFFLDHGTGTVIGETCVIGDNVKIYQGVTLGALHITKELAKTKRHPTVEDNVVIYAGATILGGETIIGHDSVVGGNVWLTNSLAPHSLVYYSSKMEVKIIEQFDGPIDYVI